MLIGMVKATGTGVALGVLGYVVGIFFGGVKEFTSYYSLIIGGVGLCFGVPISLGIFIPLQRRAALNKSGGKNRISAVRPVLPKNSAP